MLTNQKIKTYNSLSVIINQFAKTIQYKYINIIIDFANFADIIINIMVQHHGSSDPMFNNRKLVFISKFWVPFFNFIVIMKAYL